MNRTHRSLVQTFLLAACVLTLSLTGFDLTAQAENNGDDSRIVQPAHATLQQSRRRARRPARTTRRRTRRRREFVDRTNMRPPAIPGAVRGDADYVPPGGGSSSDTSNPDAANTSGQSSTQKPISGGILNGKAISLPKPSYPAIARSARASGKVVVEVIIDESGRVISARAVSGHPLLQASAVQAAYGARFSPTQLSGQPVKVTGTISYNFVQ